MLLWPLLITTALAAGPKILGGEPARLEQWPSVVSLHRGDALTCTGTLISSTIVLTAAHCSAADRVLLDTVDLNAPQQVVPIESFHAYPGWSTTYDVAWVRLESPVLTPSARLTLDCLADHWLYDGAPAQIAGFGSLDAWADESTHVLHAAHVSILDADCDESAHGCMATVSPGGELTAGGGGVDSCVGDSGGGLWVEDGDELLLAGITSRGRRPATTPCGDGGIYVRVDAIADWLEQDAGVTLERPSCPEQPVNQPPQPHAAAVILPALGSSTTQLVPGDPDPSDQHSYTLGKLVTGLVVHISDEGKVQLQDTLGTPRSGVVEFWVHDDGTPPRSATLAVPYTVTPAPSSRGCSATGPYLTSWLLLLMVALITRAELSSPPTRVHRSPANSPPE